MAVLCSLCVKRFIVTDSSNAAVTSTIWESTCVQSTDWSYVCLLGSKVGVGGS